LSTLNFARVYKIIHFPRLKGEAPFSKVWIIEIIENLRGPFGQPAKLEFGPPTPEAMVHCTTNHAAMQQCVQCIAAMQPVHNHEIVIERLALVVLLTAIDRAIMPTGELDHDNPSRREQD
jgi:hypothetical protein